ncbi:ATP-grasp domain-containing protein [Brevibacterium jeotgali]|uniref:ATP-grasp domain-containing protein n=1 Tax=Brevibacterium jeotgali TaxID=1262550 RepID=A0A2H1L2F6_9MICO|nr:ATP-grasp domain-containing protein [Brevibacterium jeotgali]TWC03039.1 ATP-grasp domain-containing protein [Brevibacterium jeotgali]SMY11062.1 ATP-grasp domain-containing protein [Brevibacterium jeotgali]
MSPANILVLAMTHEQRLELETVRGAGDLRFHDLLDYEHAVAARAIDFEGLLAAARAELEEFDGTVDGIIAHWDFPVSVLAPILAAERGLPAPPLSSLLASEHKYWSRLAQRECIPECVPGFVAFDPFDDGALSAVREQLAFPFWVKPVKAHSSALGFKITDEEDFLDAQSRIRDSIEEMGDAFNAVLSRVDLPRDLGEAGGNTCLAEQFVEGMQCAPEGTVFRGEFRVHGLFDMHKDGAGTSFDRFDYPAGSVPESVQERMIDLTRRYLEHIGFDNGCFNSEFMWDEAEDQLWLIEVNTRISQSHSDLFLKVDGASNHEVAIDIARGRPPRMPYREGRYAVAGQCMVFHDEDGVVTRIPDEADMDRLRETYPDVRLVTQVAVGDRLSELPGQDSYRFVVGKLHIGAAGHDELGRLHAEIAAALPFEYTDA